MAVLSDFKENNRHAGVLAYRDIFTFCGYEIPFKVGEYIAGERSGFPLSAPMNTVFKRTRKLDICLYAKVSNGVFN
jgi:hypothetical protein